jgi:hypothetical protein
LPLSLHVPRQLKEEQGRREQTTEPTSRHTFPCNCTGKRDKRIAPPGLLRSTFALWLQQLVELTVTDLLYVHRNPSSPTDLAGCARDRESQQSLPSPFFCFSLCTSCCSSAANMDGRKKHPFQKLIRRIASLGQQSPADDDGNDAENHHHHTAGRTPRHLFRSDARRRSASTTATSGTMAEEEDFSSLPLTDRWVHKVRTATTVSREDIGRVWELTCGVSRV